MFRTRTLLCGVIKRRLHSGRNDAGYPDVTELMKRLVRLDTACLCDADKFILGDKSGAPYSGLRVMRGMNPLKSSSSSSRVMAGFAHTVQFTRPNDFFPVMRALANANAGEVLVVNSLDSTRAVAGGLFGTEAERKGLAGIVVDGPMRDTSSLRNIGIRCFSTSVTPYAGTVQMLGECQVDIECGGVLVSPGDVVVGDDDGVVVGAMNTFEQILDTAEYTQAAEENIMVRMSNGLSLHSMCNYTEHLELINKGKDSSLSFDTKDT